MNAAVSEAGRAVAAAAGDLGGVAVASKVGVRPPVPGGGPSAVATAAAAPHPAYPGGGPCCCQPSGWRQAGAGVEVPSRPGLSIPVLAGAVPWARVRCVVTPVDRDGRLANRSAVEFVGWSAGQVVDVVVESGPIIAVRRTVRTGGGLRVNPRGHLRVPLDVRRACRIAVADRVLVVADVGQQELLVIPMATLHDMLVAYRQSRDGGVGR